LKEVGEVLGDIEKDACRADDVIDRIRESVRRQKPRLEDLDINAIVAGAVKLVSDDARARLVRITTNLADEHPRAAGDRTQITQVLLNLIANGMEAMKAVRPVDRRLILNVTTRDGEVLIAVSDRGCGIGREDMQRIFDPFFTTRRDGMGLGLPVSESIVVAHKGRLWVENNADGGATFYVLLPVCTPNPA
jgi:two-component system sensor kinase FixL